MKDCTSKIFFLPPTRGIMMSRSIYSKSCKLCKSPVDFIVYNIHHNIKLRLYEVVLRS